MGLAAEQALAKGVADDGNVAAVFILLGGEEPAAERRRGEDLEVTQCRPLGIQALGPRSIRVVEEDVLHAAEFREGFQVALKIEVVGPGNGIGGELRQPGFHQHHDAVRLGIARRAEQERVRDGENRGVRPDAQGQGEHGDRGETPGLAQLAESEAKVG